MQGHAAHVFVQRVPVRVFAQGQIENGQGHVGRGHANRIAAQLAGELRQHPGDRFGGAGFGDHHVQRRAAPTAIRFVVVVDQILVVGVGVHRLQVTVHDAKFVVDNFQRRHDGVGGA